jgi:hypothetical protein
VVVPVNVALSRGKIKLAYCQPKRMTKVTLRCELALSTKLLETFLNINPVVAADYGSLKVIKGLDQDDG